MNKALAISAVTGILFGTIACGGNNTAEPPKAPSTDMAAPGAKASCSGTSAPATPATPAAPGTETKGSCGAKK